MPVCAYCNEDAALTKEHIWPGGLIKRFGEAKTYEPRSEKFHGGEPVIKDVCARCNNVKLSALDDYICCVFDQYMANVIPAGEGAELEYNYHMLLRGLLKISFNSARAMKDEIAVKVLRRYVPYILNGGFPRNIAFRLQIVTSSKAINVEDGSEIPVEPYIFRNAQIPYDGTLSKRFLVRLVAINSYWFYLVFSVRNEPKHKWKKFLEGLSSWQIPMGIDVPATGSTIKLKVNQTTYFHPELLGTMRYANGA